MRAAIKFWDETHKARGFTDATLTATVAKGLGLPYTPSIEKAKPPTLLAPSEPAPVENSVPPKDRMKPVYATPTDAALAQARGLYDGAMPYWAEVIK
jgi:hypothetical protein